MGCKKYLKLLLLFICFSVSAIVSATQTLGGNSFLSTMKNGHVIIELGVYRATQGRAQHINIQDLIGDTFSVSKHNDTNALIGLGYFVDGNSWNTVKMSYGINAFYLAPTSVSGNVTQENIFTNLSYSYSVRHAPIYVIAKSTINLKSSKYALVLDAGVGPDFMKVYSFNENSLDGGVTIPDQLFSSNNKTTLSATLGIGLKVNQALGQLSTECGYRFFYLGQGQFNINNSQVLNRLNTGKIYANAIACSIST